MKEVIFLKSSVRYTVMIIVTKTVIMNFGVFNANEDAAPMNFPDILLTHSLAELKKLESDSVANSVTDGSVVLNTFSSQFANCSRAGNIRSLRNSGSLVIISLAFDKSSKPSNVAIAITTAYTAMTRSMEHIERTTLCFPFSLRLKNPTGRLRIHEIRKATSSGAITGLHMIKPAAIR